MKEQFKTDEELKDARRLINTNLKQAIECLKRARETCEIHSFWHLSYPGNELDDILSWLEGIEVPVVIPVIRD